MLLHRLAALVTLLIPSISSVCTEPRIRKSWDRLKAEGLTETYITAIQVAIERGFHQDFADVHLAQTTVGDEAHRRGSFLFWHRRFLLAYENMLRSLGPEFECVTIPYWNYYRENNLLAGSNGGSTLLDVSAICAELIPGPAIRTDWASYRTFPGIGLASTIASIDVDHFERLSRNLENSVHNSIHSWLGATMSSYSSPLDPIFYSHHATIDLLHTIYYECKAGTGQTNEFKQTSPVAYHPFRDAPSAMSGFLMAHPASNRVTAFFEDLPNRYFEYVDTREIPNLSYSYRQESNFNTEITRMTCVNPVQPTPAPPSPTPDVSINSTTNATLIPTTAPAPPPGEEVLVGLPAPSVADENMAKFYDQIIRACLATGETEAGCKIQAKNIECLCFNMLFGVEDFSDEFWEMMNIQSVLKL